MRDGELNRIPFDRVVETLANVLVSLGFSADRGAQCARLFAETTCDGVYSHGVNRFPRFVATVRNGSVDPGAEPAAVAGFGGLERWDGNRGPGNLNALAMMNRAMELGRAHGVGCVALRNTNHWMRGGTYGWQAARERMIGMCWTNTMPNLPPWGASQAAIGNNPLVIAVPRRKGPVVLDMAMSQFSYGALESYRKRGVPLPVEGGFDSDGRLTRDASAIEASQRPLPIGYWKGSGLAVVLDMVAAMLSLGSATHQMATDPLLETGLSQVFLVVHPDALGEESAVDALADEIVTSLHRSRPSEEGQAVRYPGEQTARIREANLERGLPIEPGVWDQVLAMT